LNSGRFRFLISFASELLLRKAKEFGFSDLQLAHLLGVDETTLRKMRKEKGIQPTYKGVDTCGAEFEAYTPTITPLTKLRMRRKFQRRRRS
jgi:carbamoyl-phosphate synthase large subunit